MNAVGDTIFIQFEPCFSSEVGKGFLKWENGGGFVLSLGGEGRKKFVGHTR